MISIRRHPKLRSVTCRRFGTCKVLTFANFRRVSESLKFKRSCASRVERIASNWRLLLQERKIPPVSNHSGKPQWQTTVANDSDALNKLVYVLTSRRTFQNFDKFKPVSESDSLIRSLRLIIWDWSDRWMKFLRVSILPVHAHRLHWEVREFAKFRNSPGARQWLSRQAIWAANLLNSEDLQKSFWFVNSFESSKTIKNYKDTKSSTCSSTCSFLSQKFDSGVLLALSHSTVQTKYTNHIKLNYKSHHIPPSKWVSKWR